MKEDKFEKKLLSEINKNTRHGTAALQNGELGDALRYFESSFKKSLQLGDDFTERACAFNVGAVYISLNKAEQGLEFLQRALPPSGGKDGKSNGDLYYNFGLGYEVLDNPAEAVKYYELALDEYKEEKDNFLMEAEVGKRAGSLYTKLGQWLPASRCFGITATANSRLGDTEGQTISLCRQATCLYQGGRLETALQAADECSILCQRVKEEPVLGRLYNELGLTYTQCHEFAKAATCFELALPLSRTQHSDRYQEAIILQNLGAVYNSLGDYQRALPLHEAAVLIHAELGQRNSQGQCFQNLAFAYSQLEDHDAAGECYLHALQAAKDTGDQHGQWQAMEGLGAVAYNEGQLKRASRYFKMALQLLTNADSDPVALQRIQSKLESALQGAVNGEVMVNGNAKRVTNRQDSFDIEAIRQRAVHNRMIEKPLGFVPQGFGDYNDENDRAFSRASFRQLVTQGASVLRHGHQDVVDGEVTERQGSRHINKTRRMLGTGLEVDRTKPDAVLSVTYEEDIDIHRKPVGHRRKAKGLLREEHHDSEDEWRNNMREIYSSSSSEPDELPYKERRFPDEEVAVRLHRKHKKRLVGIFDNEEKWLEEYHTSLEKRGKNNKRHSNSSALSPHQSPLRRKNSENQETDRESNEIDATSGAKMVRQKQIVDHSNSEINEEHQNARDEDDAENEISTSKQESSETEDDMSNSRGLVPPPLPSLLPLGATYELPTQTADDAVPHDAHSFRPSTSHHSKNEDGERQSEEDEPIYSTLKSVRTLPFNLKGSLLHPNDSDHEGPDLPSRPGSKRASNTEETEEILQSYKEKRDSHLVQRQNTIQNEGEVQLPSKHAKKNSKICSIM